MIYAPLVVRCKNLQVFIRWIELDPAEKEVVDRMERLLVEDRNKIQDYFMPTNFNLLLSMPHKHLFK